MIDTEHSSGDVNKMLLGSFVEEYDNDEGDDQIPFNFPAFNYSASEDAMSPGLSFSDNKFKVDLQSQAVPRSTPGFRYSNHGSALLSPANR